MEHNLKFYFMLPQPLLVIRVIHAKTAGLYQVPKLSKSKMIHPRVKRKRKVRKVRKEKLTPTALIELRWS